MSEFSRYVWKHNGLLGQCVSAWRFADSAAVSPSVSEEGKKLAREAFGLLRQLEQELRYHRIDPANIDHRKGS